MFRAEVMRVLLVILLLTASHASAQSWQSRLQDGSRVEVDPRTNRATVQSAQGVVTPLWDGVHKLEDGSTIIIRSGVMVPNTEVVRLRREGRAEPGGFVKGVSSCLTLVRKVCGLHDECLDQQSCDHAKQLRSIELEEEREHSSRSLMQTPSQCVEALEDEAFFVPCGPGRREASATPCQRLVDSVCGSQNQCADVRGCSLAKQLRDMEHRERLTSVNPEAVTDSGKQCRSVSGEADLFSACAR